MGRDGEDNNTREMILTGAGQLGSAALGYRAGHLDGALIAAALPPHLTVFLKRVANEWTRKRDLVITSALEASQVTSNDEFWEALTSRPDLIALTEKILGAARVSSYEAKLRAFGILLGEAVMSGSRLIKDTQVLVDALTDLEEVHVLTLGTLASKPPDYREDEQRMRQDHEPRWAPLQIEEISQ